MKKNWRKTQAKEGKIEKGDHIILPVGEKTERDERNKLAWTRMGPYPVIESQHRMVSI